MDHKDARHFRLHILAILFFAVMAVYLGVLFNTQVNHYDEYYASSIRTIARPETVEAARGNITDRNGKVLVSSGSSYSTTSGLMTPPQLHLGTPSDSRIYRAS